jgi:hypothetical protein
LNERRLALEKELRARGKPSILDRRVEAPAHLDWAWDAFTRLSKSRTVDPMAGPRPIPFSEIVSYARALGMTRSEWRELDRLVSALDDCYIRHHQKLASREAERKAAEDRARAGSGNRAARPHGGSPKARPGSRRR